MCDRVILINQGSIVADQSLPNLKQNYPGLSLEQIFRQLTGLPIESKSDVLAD
jgi:ABC-type Na+ transport system ATPase subunit NatA